MAGRVVARIELGIHEGRIVQVLFFDDDTSQAFLLQPLVARKLFTEGLALVQQLERTAAPPAVPSSAIGVGESVQMRLIQGGHS